MNVDVLAGHVGGFGRQVPMVFQSEAAECGMACVAMVAASHRLHVDMTTLRAVFDTSLRGSSLSGIMAAAQRLGFSARALRVASVAELRRVRGPVILHWDLDHFVVLARCGRSKFHIHDPAKGRAALAEDAVSRSFTGVVLELAPAKDFRRLDLRNRLRITDLWTRIAGFKRHVAQLLALSTLIQLFVLATPLFLRFGIDEVAATAEMGLFLGLAGLFVGMTVLNAVVGWLRGYILLHLGTLLSFQIVSNLFRHLLRIPIPFFERRHVGDVLSRFSSVEPIKNMLTEGIVGSLIDGAMALATVAVMFYYSPFLASLSVAALAVYLAARIGSFPSYRRKQEEVIAWNAKESSTLIESVQGLATIKTSGNETGRERLWNVQYGRYMNANARFRLHRVGIDTLGTAIAGAELVAIAYFAVALVVDGVFTMGMVFAFMAYRTSFSGAAAQMVERFMELRTLGLHLDRLADIVRAPQEALEAPGGPARPLRGALRVADIAFAYGSDGPRVLDGVAMSIGAGERVAITGVSGSGKTTLMNILIGLYRPDEGTVFVDGTPIETFGLRNYRSQIGVVLQDDQLFNGTIAENISLFDPEEDRERVVDAARKAMVHDEIDAFTMGYESPVGEAGTALSGGQRQRVMLARALYGNPRILFMDEGMANLDVALERRVVDSLAGLRLTTVVVAHRPETIRAADRVFEVDGGGVRPGTVGMHVRDGAA